MVLSFACKKYPNGPLISFRSVENRIKGSWKIIEFTSDGIDSLQYYNDSCGSTFQIWNSDVSEWESQHYRINFIYKPFYGGFTFDDKKKVMNVDFGSGKRILGPIGKGSSIWKILKLTNKKFKISTDYNGRNYIISFKQ
ncbi:MAG: hypothetical protein A2X08_10950 [Bacteroidetes bacterium GWA2_32_17]|nr:MAG: hypothetical protein A2X08_10950 [Bacteroidetes bacterium GWA2_32_17]